MADKKVFYSKEAMFPLIREWQNSTMTKKQFCEQAKVGYHTFNYWFKKFNCENEHVKPGFTEYKVVDQKCLPGIRLSFTNGVTVELPSGTGCDMVNYLVSNWQ
jgi:hypothetical protein